MSDYCELLISEWSGFRRTNVDSYKTGQHPNSLPVSPLSPLCSCRSHSAPTRRRRCPAMLTLHIPPARWVQLELARGSRQQCKRRRQPARAAGIRALARCAQVATVLMRVAAAFPWARRPSAAVVIRAGATQRRRRRPSSCRQQLRRAQMRAAVAVFVAIKLLHAD